MFTRIGAYLAKCFDAHYTTENKRVKDAAIKLRQAAVEFNKAAEELAKLKNHSTYVHFRTSTKNDLSSLKYFRIDQIECRVFRIDEIV